MHAFNVSSNLNCIGLIEEDNEEEKILPEKWNINDEGVYSFKYRCKNNKLVYIFKIIFEEDMINIHAVSLHDSTKLYSISIKQNELNVQEIGKNSSVFENYKKEILNKISGET